MWRYCVLKSKEYLVFAAPGVRFLLLFFFCFPSAGKLQYALEQMGSHLEACFWKCWPNSHLLEFPFARKCTVRRASLACPHQPFSKPKYWKEKQSTVKFGRKKRTNGDLTLWAGWCSREGQTHVNWLAGKDLWDNATKQFWMFNVFKCFQVLNVLF